jgi:hypothetical protein
MSRVIVFLVWAIMILSLSGCKENNASLTGGKWTAVIEGITVTRQFNDDGTTIEWVNKALRFDGFYTIDGNKISAAMTSSTIEERKIDIPLEINWQWAYSIRGNKLTLTELEDNKKVIYTRE